MSLVIDGRKLGRLPSRVDSRTLRLAHYLVGDELPEAPPARNWARTSSAPNWGTWRNDDLGDCTCAAIAHLFQSQAANAGKSLVLRDDDVVKLYGRASGYDPTRPETDRGAQMLDVLCALREVGMGCQRISAFTAIDPTNRSHIEIAVNLFGGVYVGADLPLSAQRQFIWNVAPPGKRDATYDRSSWGPHAMALLGYDQRHVTLITWGQIKLATIEWVRAYVSEAWVIIDPLWVDEGLCPSGFDLAQLRRDLVDIHRGREHRGN